MTHHPFSSHVHVTSIVAAASDPLRSPCATSVLEGNPTKCIRREVTHRSLHRPHDGTFRCDSDPREDSDSGARIEVRDSKIDFMTHELPHRI